MAFFSSPKFQPSTLNTIANTTKNVTKRVILQPADDTMTSSDYVHLKNLKN